MDATDRSSLPGRPSRTVEPRERAALPRDPRELPPLDPVFSEILEAGLQAIGLTLSDAQRAAIDAHVQLLLAWNDHINLSGLRTPAAIARGHVLDALVAVPALRSLTAGRRVALLDIGSGGGFPGLPLAVAVPARRAALVDSIAKKAAFLDAAANAVRDTLRGAARDEPEIVALNERVEDLADEPDHRDRWDLVVARAVGTVAEIVELGLPLVHRGGYVAIWKRTQVDEEIAQARRIVQAVGGTPPRVLDLGAERVGLPGNRLVVVRKGRPTPDRYPRPAGERKRGALP